MPLFYFSLNCGGHAFTDEEGKEFADAATARSHAEAIAQNVMQNRELQIRCWRIEVSDDYLQPLCAVYFSEIDSTLGHLPPALRQTIVTASRRASHLSDVVVKIQNTLADVQATLESADRLLAATRNSG